ncbi:hypothetical protein KUCAC02_028282, partial [Chaenocephalus aceratus]
PYPSSLICLLQTIQLISPPPPLGQTLGLYPEEVSSLRSGFSDTGAIFYRDRIKPAQGKPINPIFTLSSHLSPAFT